MRITRCTSDVWLENKKRIYLEQKLISSREPTPVSSGKEPLPAFTFDASPDEPATAPSGNRKFADKLADKSRGIGLFGTCPPPAKLGEKILSLAAASAAGAVREIDPDGVVIYDIQDEKSRSGEKRPFPFNSTAEPRVFAQLIKKDAPNCHPVVYRSMLSGESEEDFRKWVVESMGDSFGLETFVMVGAPAQDGETVLAVPEACRVALGSAQDPSLQQRHLSLGGITLPERHRAKKDEHLRLSQKVADGVQFFTSQVVYSADNAIWMLEDYVALCKENKQDPVRIVFTFAPFGSQKTVDFMRWLGVDIPAGTAERVLAAGAIKEKVAKACQICWENWHRILISMERQNIRVPIGFCVEAVSKSKYEQAACITLYADLEAEMQAYYGRMARRVERLSSLASAAVTGAAAPVL